MRRVAARSLLLLAALPLAGQADDRLLLAGGEVAEASYYSYVGTVLPLATLDNGDRLVQRYWLDGFGYEYDGGPGRVQADAWGGEVALGYVRASDRGWAQASVGLRHTDTDLEPDDPGADARDSQTGVKLELQGERHLGDGWRAGVIGSWASQQSAWWSRLRLMHRPGPVYGLGGEVIAGGNDESRSTAAGLVWTVSPAGGSWTFGFRAGYRWQDEEDSPYGGIELGYAF